MTYWLLSLEQGKLNAFCEDTVLLFLWCCPVVGLNEDNFAANPLMVRGLADADSREGHERWPWNVNSLR